MTNLWRYVGLLLLVQWAVACSDGAPAGEVAENGAATIATNANATGNAPAAQAPRPAPAEDSRLVIAFGDSLFAGYGLEPNQGFAPALERALAARDVPARVVNAGVSGDTSAAGLQRLVFTLDGLDRRPDLVILGLGGNDALRGLSPAETRRNLAAILAELRRRQIPVLLTGMLAPRNMGADYAEAFDPIYPDLAREYGAELYPFFLDGVITRPELLLRDGMHPNARGVDAIVERVAPRVAGELASQVRG